MFKHFYLFIIILVFGSIPMAAQFDNPNNSVRFDANETNSTSPSGFEMPAIKKPTISNNNNPYAPNNSDFGENKPSPIDVSKGDGLLDYKTDKAPKAFAKDKEAKKEYGKDQYLGDFKTTAGKVTIMYRDHEFVDGDRIKVYINGIVVEPNAYLDASFRGFTFALQTGFNKIDFEALNQGTSGPNTAQLEVLDEIGNVLAAHQWNLLTGNKATVIVVKD